MEYSKLMTLLSENMHPEYWVSSNDQDGLHTYALKENVSITITEFPEEENNEVLNKFTERFTNESANFQYYALQYNGTTIKNVFLFLVDGGRAFIPAPNIVDQNYIQDDDLIISVIIDRLTFESRYEYEDTTKYLDRAKLVYQKSLIK